MARCSGVSIDCGGLKSHSFEDVPVLHSIGVPTFPGPCASPVCMTPVAVAKVFAAEEPDDEEELCPGAPVCLAV